MSRKKLINVFIYIASDLLSKAIPFLLMPVVASYLSVAEYGEVSYFIVLAELLQIFVIFGSHQYYRYKYFGTENKEKEIFLYSVLLSLSFSIIFLVCISVFIIFSGTSTYFISLPFVAFFQSVIALKICELQNKEKPLFIAVTSGFLSLLIFLTSIALLRMEMGVMARVYSINISVIVIGLGILYFSLKGIKKSSLFEAISFYKEGGSLV
ncbi:oligosaccharide flippase family protein [Pseudoalteromonas piscicida]